jgi:DNA-binding MarR family transcriptional regulator
MNSSQRQDQLELERFLPYRLSVLANTVSAAIASAYSERHDLSIPEWRVMAVLAREPGLSAAEVTLRTAMDKVAVSRAVARLLAGGRLRRRRTSHDRRRSSLELTASGRDVYRRIVPWALEYERRLLTALSPAETAALDAALRKLMDFTKAPDGDQLSAGVPSRPRRSMRSPNAGRRGQEV